MASHYIERIRERLDNPEAHTLSTAIVRLATSLPDNRAYGILVARVPEARGSFVFDAGGSGPSNGTDLWAIIRQRRIVTVFWRRTAQPSTRESLRVDVVGRAIVT